ncbi:MAG TPA: hypothetical protein VKF81_16665, partial [Blastocatellia bacterium]|nr:hypothetical protein [Blastocatellia bacterium]
MSRLRPIILIFLPTCVFWPQQPAAQEIGAAEAHHQRGVEYHLRRCLDDASREYARALELDPPRDLTPGQWQLVRRFAPRIYTTPAEFFPLKDFAVIVHPTSRQ